jgi:hypothetical protein
MQITIAQVESETYELNEDGEFVCTHANYEIEKACCSPFQIGESGYIECGCQGRDSVFCPNINCTGLTDADVERIFQYE